MPVSVTSHLRFLGSDPRLGFGRDSAWGMRLAVPAGRPCIATWWHCRRRESRGELRPIAPGRFAARLRALLDGFSIRVAVGLRGARRAQVMRHVREFLDTGLLADC